MYYYTLNLSVSFYYNNISLGIRFLKKRLLQGRNLLVTPENLSI